MRSPDDRPAPRPTLEELRAAAQQLIRDGYKLLPTNGKAPWDAATGAGRVGWNAYALTLESIASEIVPPITGIGVRLGPSSGASSMPISTAPRHWRPAAVWLPRTGCIFGRASKPASHWIYLASPSPKSFLCEDVPRASRGDGAAGPRRGQNHPRRVARAQAADCVAAVTACRGRESESATTTTGRRRGSTPGTHRGGPPPRRNWRCSSATGRGPWEPATVSRSPSRASSCVASSSPPWCGR